MDQRLKRIKASYDKYKNYLLSYRSVDFYRYFDDKGAAYYETKHSGQRFESLSRLLDFVDFV